MKQGDGPVGERDGDERGGEGEDADRDEGVGKAGGLAPPASASGRAAAEEPAAPLN